ncbi:hypothetical protein VPH35_071466 [Triticum aestivum]
MVMGADRVGRRRRCYNRQQWELQAAMARWKAVTMELICWDGGTTVVAELQRWLVVEMGPCPLLHPQGRRELQWQPRARRRPHARRRRLGAARLHEQTDGDLARDDGDLVQRACTSKPTASAGHGAADERMLCGRAGDRRVRMRSSGCAGLYPLLLFSFLFR